LPTVTNEEDVIDLTKIWFYLLPKIDDAVQIKKYRPVCLLNASFKIFSEVGTNHITRTSQKVIRPTQTLLLLGKHILEKDVS
jgi:hypothetical protein